MPVISPVASACQICGTVLPKKITYGSTSEQAAALSKTLRIDNFNGRAHDYPVDSRGQHLRCRCCRCPVVLSVRSIPLLNYVRGQNRDSNSGLSQCNPLLTEMLFEYLPLKVLWQCRAVCRTWCAISPASRDPRVRTRMFAWGEPVKTALQMKQFDEEVINARSPQSFPKRLHFFRFWMSGFCVGLGDIIQISSGNDASEPFLGKILTLYTSGTSAMNSYRETLLRQRYPRDRRGPKDSAAVEVSRHTTWSARNFPWVDSAAWMRNNWFFRRSEIPEIHQPVLPPTASAKQSFKWLVTDSCVEKSEVFECHPMMGDRNPVSSFEALCSLRTFEGFMQASAAKSEFELFIPKDVRVAGDNFGAWHHIDCSPSVKPLSLTTSVFLLVYCRQVPGLVAASHVPPCGKLLFTNLRLTRSKFYNILCNILVVR